MEKMVRSILEVHMQKVLTFLVQKMKVRMLNFQIEILFLVSLIYQFILNDHLGKEEHSEEDGDGSDEDFVNNSNIEEDDEGENEFEDYLKDDESGDDDNEHNDDNQENEEDNEEEDEKSNESGETNSKEKPMVAWGNKNVMQKLKNAIVTGSGGGPKGCMSKTMSTSNLRMKLVLFGDMNVVFWYDANMARQILKVGSTERLSKATGKKMKWIDTFQDYRIRSEEHGNNALLRTPGGSTTKMLGFVATTKKTDNEEKDEKNLTRIAEHRAKFFYSIMRDYANSKEGPENAFESLEQTSGTYANGEPAGVFGYLLKNRSANDRGRLLTRLGNNLKAFFKNDPTFQSEHIHLDKYLADYDIREFAKTHFNATDWDEVPQNAKKVFYKKYPQKDLPKWHQIVNEPFKLD